MQIGLPGLLGLLFIGLKLGGVIDWSWLWVLAPFWIGLVIAAVAFLVWFFAAAMIAARAPRRFGRIR